MKAKVLIIEDDGDIADLVAMYLEREGIETLIGHDGETGVSMFESHEPDMVILDINLPGMDGYEVLQSLKRSRDVPVLMLTARREDEDAILGFGMGADDYVSKPFSPKVLVARIRMHLSRARKRSASVEPAAMAGRVEFGPYVLDSRTFSLLKDGVRVSVSPRELDLLIFLAASPGEPKSQDEVFRQVWGREYGDFSTVAVHVQRLRKKLEDNPANPLWLKTAHGRGYFFDPEGGG